MDANLEYYRVFCYAAKNSSLTAAARELSVSQPAVSQQIRALEDTLGTKLFVRTARGIRLTQEGTLLYSYVSRGLDLIEEGEKKLRRMENLDIGEVHIGASDMTLHYFLLPWLEQFHRKYPGIKVTVTNGPTPETLDVLRSGKIDFGVISGPVKNMPGVRLLPVRTIQDVFIAGEGFSHLQGKILNFSELSSLPLIFLEEKTSSRRYIDRFLSEQGVSVTPEFELATSDMIVQFALRNLGVGCVVRDFAEEYLRQGKLSELRFTSPIPERMFYIACMEEDVLPQAAQALLKLIEKDQKGTGWQSEM